MSIEGGGDILSKQLREQLSPEHIRRAEEPFDERLKINLDYTNAWAYLVYVLDQKCIEDLEPIRLYEEYFRSKPRERKEVVYIMSMSDPEAVAALDRAVTEFNTDLDRIKQEEDWEAVENFIAKIKKLMGKE